MRLKLNWYAGNITKYAERAEHKGQLVEDLIKIVDYALMWIEPQEMSKEQWNRLQVVLNRKPVVWIGSESSDSSGKTT